MELRARFNGDEMNKIPRVTFDKGFDAGFIASLHHDRMESTGFIEVGNQNGQMSVLTQGGGLSVRLVYGADIEVPGIRSGQEMLAPP